MNDSHSKPKLLIGRDPAKSQRWVEAAEHVGWAVECLSPITFESPFDPTQALEAAQNSERFHVVVFTSPEGVHRFHAMNDLKHWKHHFVGVVGPATQQLLKAKGFQNILVGREDTGESLANAFPHANQERNQVLVVAPEASRPELRQGLAEKGWSVHAPVFYRTVASKGVRKIQQGLQSGRWDAILLASPSGVEAIEEQDQKGIFQRAVAKHLKVIAIGPTTAQALQKVGAQPLVLARPVPDELARTLVLLSDVPEEDSAVAQETILRQTPIYPSHVAAGARMVPFAGWEMPVQYTGVIEEHRAVRTAAGLFDVSHMGEALVEGPQALDLLQYLTCNDVKKLKLGRAHYTALTTEKGTIIDDLLIYHTDEQQYLLVWNAANHQKDFAWITQHATNFDVDVKDVADQWFQIAIQGPRAQQILLPLTDPSLAEMRYYGFSIYTLMGESCIVSRTGYTGEDGFEIYGPAAMGNALWQKLLEQGSEFGLLPVGLAARDTLRLEAKMALYGQDIDESTTPIEADLGWIVKLKKGDFLGREVLARQKTHGADRKLVGFHIDGRRIARQGCPALVAGREVGRVTSGTYAPWLEQSLGLVYLPIEFSEVGQAFEIDIRGRSVAAKVVETPFYKRAS